VSGMSDAAYPVAMTNRTPPASGARRYRADAERSIDAILQAALEAIATSGDANMAAIARAAGVSRPTLYTYFPTWEALVDGAMERAIAEARQVFAEIDLEDRPAPEIVAAMVNANWQTLNRYRELFNAAVKFLPPSRFRSLHQPLIAPVKTLVARGQAEGDLRTDMPTDWLVATIFGLMHQAAQEVNARRLPARTAGAVVAETVLSAITIH
jgi:TetR/AcrR family transcriptional repressor of mexCD-oprJ operon